MTIPKVIYQTWKHKNLSPNIIKIRDNIQNINPGYKIVLYDDDEIDEFIKSNFDKYIYDTYSKLNVGAARADFWRYCILYKYGGVYLDMDSEILRPLDEIIDKDDHAIITREGNKGYFNNWIMIFQKEHPILLEAINNCCYNIKNKTSDNIALLTGPWGPLTDAVNKVMCEFYHKKTNLYFEDDDVLNNTLNNPNIKTRCKFYKIDMGSYAQFKHRYVRDLYKNHTYWRSEKQLYKIH